MNPCSCEILCNVKQKRKVIKRNENILLKLLKIIKSNDDTFSTFKKRSITNFDVDAKKEKLLARLNLTKRYII